jgi:hypothetical protein
MPFLDIPSGPSTPSSLLLDDSKLAAGRPRLKETPISMPGGDDRQPAKGYGFLPLYSFSVLKTTLTSSLVLWTASYRSLRSELITPVVRVVHNSRCRS